jgi:hypothetical protein
MPERRWTSAAAIVAAAVLGFALWQHAMPATFVSQLGLNHAATAEVHAALGVRAPVVGLAAYTAVFRALLVVAFAAYGLLLATALRSPPAPGRRAITRLALALPIAVALLMPADLSTDVYAYVGYGRLAVIHGLNPHVTPSSELVRLGDPTAPFIHWTTPSPYGPLATLLSMAAVAVAPSGSLLVAVVVMKLFAAAALIGCALAAERFVRAYDPTRAEAALVATALNPLLLIEGPGNGHNDIVTVVFVLLAFLALARGRARLAALALGAAAAVKLIPLLLLPWVAFIAAWPRAEETGGGPSARARAGKVAAVVGVAFVPLAVLYVPFWRGARTFASLAARWQAGHTDAPGAPSAYIWVVVALYALGSALLFRARRGAAPAAVATMISIWAVLSMPLLPLLTDKWFPGTSPGRGVPRSCGGTAGTPRCSSGWCRSR